MFSTPEFSFITPAQVDELLCGIDNLLIEVGEHIIDDANADVAMTEKIRRRIQAAREAVEEQRS